MNVKIAQYSSDTANISSSKLLTGNTLIGLSLSAVWRVEEEWRHLQEPVPIPRHPVVERTAVNLDQLKRQHDVTNKNAVSTFKTIFLRKISYCNA